MSKTHYQCLPRAYTNEKSAVKACKQNVAPLSIDGHHPGYWTISFVHGIEDFLEFEVMRLHPGTWESPNTPQGGEMI